MRRLVRDGVDVTAVTRPDADPWRLTGVNAARRSVDIRDRGAVSRLLLDIRPEWVFHLAAHGAYSWQTASLDIVATNTLGTVNLVDAAREAGVEAFVHAGSSAEYGFKGHAPSEVEAVEPASAYAVSKVAATLYCQAVGRETDSHICTLRLYSVYGPWEEPNRLVPTLVDRCLAGTLPPLVQRDTARDFVHVDDVCEAFVRAASRPTVPSGAIFNIGSGHQTTLEQIVAIARSEFAVDAEPRWNALEPRSWDTSSWVSDPTRARSQLDWRPTIELRAGLRAFADWLGTVTDEVRRRY